MQVSVRWRTKESRHSCHHSQAMRVAHRRNENPAESTESKLPVVENGRSIAAAAVGAAALRIRGR
jgi:hypothetical protein